MEDSSVAELVRRNENLYTTGDTKISRYVTFNLYENINKIEAYLNSKFTSGDTDDKGRAKPFFNIVTAATNIWMRATDIDRKNIKVRATKSTDVFADFLATIHLQDWMRRENFGTFLNEWGRVLSRYGSAIVKFIEADGKLHSMVVPWGRVIVDSIDIDNDVIIEILEFTPAQLRRQTGYNQDVVDALIDTVSTRKNSDKTPKDNKSGFIRVYEVHGEMPLSYLTGKDSDDDTYVQQMHVVSFVSKKEGDGFDDFTLIKGKEAKNPYMLTHLVKEDGRVQAIGAVENLFEAQWMMNHTAKQIKDQLDLASKLIFQTSDENFVGRNAMSESDTGDILVHAVNQPITQVANNSHDTTAIQNFGAQWKALASEINGVSESMMGNAAPSGTAWRQVEALLQESHSLFALMTQNKALALEDMLRTYVIPYIKKQMDTSEEISATLDSYNLDKIDRKFVPYLATKMLSEKLIAHITATGEIPLLTDAHMQDIQSSVQDAVSAQGAQRFFKPDELDNVTWKQLFKDLEWDLEIDITGEQSDNQSTMATLSTVLQTVASNPGIFDNPKAKLILNKILTETNVISPIELQDLNSPTTQQQGQAPVPPMQSVGQVGVGAANTQPK